MMIFVATLLVALLVGMRIDPPIISGPRLEAIKDGLHDDAPVTNDKAVRTVFNSVGRGICGPLHVRVFASDVFNDVFEPAIR